MLFMTPHATLVYENTRGQALRLGWNTPFIISAGNGQESHSNNVYGVSTPGRHGESETGYRMSRRHIRLVGEVRRDSGLTYETARELLHTTFNPTLQGVLFFDNSQTLIRRHISCTLEELPVVEWNTRRNCLVFEIMLVALDPFWKGQPLLVSIAQVSKRWSFPMSIPQRGSKLGENMVFGLQRATLETRFQNMGNVESGFSATIRARHGSVTNPSIRDEETGQQIKLNYTMQRFDVLEVVNYLHEKRIILNGESALHLLNAAETNFFLIQVGQSRIGYRADENVSNMEVHVRYTPEYTFVGGRDPGQTRTSAYLAQERR